MSAQQILDNQTKSILKKISSVVSGYYTRNMLDLDILCMKLGISLFQAKFDDPNISGAISKDNGNWSIVVNEDHPVQRRRFTIAHELGHYFSIIHGSISAQEYLEDNNNVIRDYYVMNRSEEVDDEVYQIERQANIIAAEILMPEEMVCSLVEEKTPVLEMATKFGVSESAMSYRLKGLKINTIETIS